MCMLVISFGAVATLILSITVMNVKYVAYIFQLDLLDSVPFVHCCQIATI